MLNLLGKGSNDRRVASGLGTNSTSESVLVDAVADRLVGCRWELGAGENRAIDSRALGRHLSLRRLSRRVGTGGAVVFCRKTIKVGRGLDADNVSSTAGRPQSWLWYSYLRVSITTEGNHTVAVACWEVRKGNTTRKDIRDGCGEQSVDFGP